MHGCTDGGLDLRWSHERLQMDLMWSINRVLQLGCPAAGVLQELGGGHARGVTGMMKQPGTGQAAVQAERLQQQQHDLAQQKHSDCAVLAEERDCASSF